MSIGEIIVHGVLWVILVTATIGILMIVNSIINKNK